MKTLLLLFSVLLSACTSWDMAHLHGRRDCLIKAVGFQDVYNYDHQMDPNRWSKVLGIFWDDERRIGHAVCVYDDWGKIIVQGSGEKKGGWVLTRDLSLKTQPRKLAELYAPNSYIRDAYYFDDL